MLKRRKYLQSDTQEAMALSTKQKEEDVHRMHSCQMQSTTESSASNGWSTQKRKGDDGFVGVLSDVSDGKGTISKKQKSESALAEVCNGLIRFLKTKGISDIAVKFCQQMCMRELEDVMSLEAENWEDSDLAFLQEWKKKNLVKLVAAGIAHSFFSGSEDTQEAIAPSKSRRKRMRIEFIAVRCRLPLKVVPQESRALKTLSRRRFRRDGQRKRRRGHMFEKTDIGVCLGRGLQ